MKTYTFINIAGFTIAFTVVFLLYNRVVTEWRTDRFHTHRQEIYRVLREEVEEKAWETFTPFPLAPAARKEIPGIRDYTRIYNARGRGIKTDDQLGYQSVSGIIHADHSLFGCFDFPLVAGAVDSTEAPGWMVLSERKARLHFGNENPIGRSVEVKNLLREDDTGQTYRVVGVAKDFPASSSIQADYILDISRVAGDEWGYLAAHTFLRLYPETDPEQVGKALVPLVEKYFEWAKLSESRYALQPLPDIYYRSGHLPADGLLLRGSYFLTLFLCLMMGLILFLAAANYVMIKTAQINRGFSALAIQTCYGAGKEVFFRQMLTESGSIALFSFLPATVLGVVLHPLAVGILSPHHRYDYHFSASAFLLLALLLLLVMGGISLFLTGFISRRLAKNGIRQSIHPSPDRWNLRQVLTWLQIFIFCGLLFGAVMITRQMRFVEEKKLGFSPENVLAIHWMNRFSTGFGSLKEELMLSPAITDVCNGDLLPNEEPGNHAFSLQQSPERSVRACILQGDADYPAIYRIELREGRSIRKESYSPIPRDFFLHRPQFVREALVNERFVREMGLQDPLDQVISDDGMFYRIVGVMRDFHFAPLHRPIEPLVLLYDRPSLTGNLLVRHHPEQRQEAIAHLEALFHRDLPNTLFTTYEYVYSQTYSNDLAISRLIVICTGIAILISGMGTFAFSLFNAVSRRKEIALRKVNGATESDIIWRFNRQMLFRTGSACVVAIPLAWNGTGRWLEGFAYRASVPVWLVPAVLFFCIVLVLCITSWQVIRAARQNPVGFLKSE